jgi:hypothetical protein
MFGIDEQKIRPSKFFNVPELELKSKCYKNIGIRHSCYFFLSAIELAGKSDAESFTLVDEVASFKYRIFPVYG